MSDDDFARAERRLDMALALADAGDGAAAAALLEEACALAPDWAAAHFARGEQWQAVGRSDVAAEAYRRALRLDPADRMGAGLRLTLMGALDAPERLPRAYVEALFDQEAHRFDDKMRGRLDYRGPEAIADALKTIAPQLPEAPTVLDLGCGTGLAGQALRLVSGWLTGFDLSARMLNRAAATGLYDSLIRGDLLSDPWRDGEASYDLIAAADVLNYIGDLGPVMQMAATSLSPGGWFVFTVEAGDARGPELGSAQRFRHSETALRPWIAAALLDISEIGRTVLRKEKGQPVDALVCTVRKPALRAAEGANAPHRLLNGPRRRSSS